MALSAEYRTSIVTLRRQVLASPYDLKILKVATVMMAMFLTEELLMSQG